LPGCSRPVGGGLRRRGLLQLSHGYESWGELFIPVPRLAEAGAGAAVFRGRTDRIAGGVAAKLRAGRS
jgi:hypothetical protein